MTETNPGFLDLYKADAKPIVEDDNLTIVDYTKLTYQQFKDLPGKDKALVVIPISPMEVHGAYLPLSSDFIESYLALDMLKEVLKLERSTTKYTIIEFPGLPIGCGTGWKLPATIHTSRKTFYDVCKQTFESLVWSGFRRVLVMSVHHGMIHSYSIEEAANHVMQKYKDLDVRIASPNHWIAKTIYLDNPRDVFTKYIEKLGQAPLTEEELQAINDDHHASIMEISFVKAINENLVDPVYKTLPRRIGSIGDQLAGLMKRKFTPPRPGEAEHCGYNGNPAMTESRDWYALFSAMIKDVGLLYVDALYADDPRAFNPYAKMRPWKQNKAGLEIARRLFFPANSTRNLVIVSVAAAIIVPWLIVILELLKQ